MFFLRELPTREMLEPYRQHFPEMDIDNLEAALQLMRDASVLMRRLEAHFAEHGMSQLRVLILLVIQREPERTALTKGELAQRIDVAKPVITRTVAALEGDGLVAVAAHESDGRARLVSLTQAGAATLERILPGYYRIINAFMADQGAGPG